MSCARDAAERRELRTVMHPRTAEILAHLDTTHALLRDVLASTADVDRGARPSAGAWSIAETVDHLATVERRVARLLGDRLAEARAAGLGPERESTPVLTAADLETARDRTRRLNAPDAARPQPGVAFEDAVAAHDASRAALRELLLSGDGLALGEITAPHPIFGPLSFYRWMAFAGGHEARHADQIRETAAALRNPRTGGS